MLLANHAHRCRMSGNMISVHVRLLLTVFIVAGLLAAQSPSGPPASTRKTAPSAATSRPSPAIGNNIIQVIDSLIAAGARKGKGEFETTDEYQSRQKALTARCGQLSFLVPDAKFAYDADQAEMKVGVSMSQDILGDATSAWSTVDLSSKLVRNTSYSGTNAYGARTLIHSRTYFDHGIALTPESSNFFSFENDPKNAEPTFPMQGGEARLLKPFLRVLLVGKLAEARVYDVQRTNSATLDYPYELKCSGLFIPFRLEEVRVVDIRSGKSIKILRTKDEAVDSGDHARPDVNLPNVKMAQYGDPFAKVGPPSNGPGSGDGIDSGSGGGPFSIGGGVSAPVPIFNPEPEYSEEARKAKFQGTVMLSCIVDETGHPKDIKVVRSLGMGLDEKAVQSLQKSLFRPALKDGKPVAVMIQWEVNFRLL